MLTTGVSPLQLTQFQEVSVIAGAVMAARLSNGSQLQMQITIIACLLEEAVIILSVDSLMELTT
ncbi:TPA: hypothetical protein DIV55_00465 [Patescibacteria group bacterium]|nr:hypothetical protein [Patescibacteria group bacterium]